MKSCPKCGNHLEERVSFCSFCGNDVRVVPDEAADPLLGVTLAGNFRLEQLIGIGAMGRVYRATQLSLSKLVAVKVLHKRLMGDAHLEKRFYREAEATSRLSHPNCIHIIEFGTAEIGLFIVMEYLEGRDLGKIIKEEFPLVWIRVCDLLIQVCAALAEAHGAGIIHRDLKPENIQVVRRRDRSELVKVLDFGIAKVRETEKNEGETPLTVAGMVCGTPEYMSPEQAKGIEITAVSDIYSLGVILYQLLTGKLPFEGASTLAVVTKQLQELPVAPSQRRPDIVIPRSLEELCLACLEKDPARRPPSAIELAACLGEIRNRLTLNQTQREPPLRLPPSPFLATGSLGTSSGSADETGEGAPTVPLPPLAEMLAAAQLSTVAADPDRLLGQAKGATDPSGVVSGAVGKDEQGRSGAELARVPTELLPVPRDTEAAAGQATAMVPRPVEPSSQDSVESTKADPSRAWRLLMVIAALLLVGMLAMGLYLWLRPRPEPTGAEKPVAASIRITKGRPAGTTIGQGNAVPVRPRHASSVLDAGSTSGVVDAQRRLVKPPASVVSSATALTGSQQTPTIQRKAAEELIAEGRQAMQRGDIDHALAAFLNAQLQNPREPEVLFELGRCYSRKGQALTAKQYLSQYLEHGKNEQNLTAARMILQAL